MNEQSDPVCVCGKTSTGKCRRCGQDMDKQVSKETTNWHEDFGDEPGIEESPEYREFLERSEPSS